MDEKRAGPEVPGEGVPAPEQPTAPAERRDKPLPPPSKRKRRVRLLLIAAAVIVIGVAVTIYYEIFRAPYESTDDAFIESHVTTISPRVSGQVLRLLIRDNQPVKEDDLLLEIDPRDYETRLAQARADLAAARSQLEQARVQTLVAQAKADQEHANVLAVEAETKRARSDLKRYQSVENRAVSRSQLDLVQTQARSSEANLEAARNREKAAQAQVTLSHAEVETAAAQLKQAEAKTRQAELDLSYTKLSAPRSGRVTRRTVEQGAYVQTGQSLLALVPDQFWIIANYKETQLNRMRPGQPVRIHVDAYPQRDYRGKVDSLQAGSGARFSLLPPENAVGNYVKVVQRVPVKIVFDEPLPPEIVLGPGMSVVPTVRVK
jgi:membrane fusion protein (multidrug efflux system)